MDRFHLQQLAELETLYRTAPIGLCLIDTDLKFVRINDQLASFNGLPAEEHAGLHLREVIPHLAEQIETVFQQVIDSGQPMFDLEIRGKTPAVPDRERDWLASFYPFKTEDGQIVGVSMVVQEISQRKRAQHILQSIAKSTSTDVGTDFFPSLVRSLALTLHVRYAFVAECLDWPTTKVRTLAAWWGDRVGENVVYEVGGTPCAQTVAGMRTFYARDIQKLFPRDTVLAELNAQSYCGLPVRDAAGEVIGHVAILDDKELEEDFSSLPALQILADRAGAELLRKRAEEKLRRQHEALAHVSRLNIMGEIATGMAHELNQPLAAIAT